jgi:hypothetical protein
LTKSRVCGIIIPERTKEIKKMKMNEKIKELEANGYNKHDTYEVDEAANGGWVITVYTSLWGFEEYLYDTDGNPVEATEISLCDKPQKIY